MEGPIQALIDDIHYGLEMGGGRFGFLSRLTPKDRKELLQSLEEVRDETKAMVNAGALKTPKSIIDHMTQRVMDKIAVSSVVAQLRPEVPRIKKMETDDG